MRFIVFDRWGNYVCDLDDVVSASYRTQINGEDTIDFEAPYVLTKGDRILWEFNGHYHEHVVNESEQDHSESETCSYVCDNSLQWDLRLAHIRYTKWTDVTAEYALTELLKLTSWEAGEIEADGTATFEWEKMTAYQALLEIAGAFGLEIEPVIEVDKWGVKRRSVSIVKQRGRVTDLRFDYSHDLDGIKKEVLADDVITACYGYGKQGSGSNSNLTFASINDGKPYIEDEDAKQLWGLPDGKDGLLHAFGYYENTDCNDAHQLLDETRGYLNQHNSPSVSYTTSIPFAALQGMELGDVIRVTDRDFTPELRLETRVGAYTQDLTTGIVDSVEFGTIVSILPDILARMYQSAKLVESEIGGVQQSIDRQFDDLKSSITTGSVTLEKDDVSGTLSVKEDGLYWNDQKLAIAE